MGRCIIGHAGGTPTMLEAHLRKHTTTQNNKNNKHKNTPSQQNNKTTNRTQIKQKEVDSTNLYIDYTKMARITSAAATTLEGSGGGSWDSEFGEARYKDFSKLWSVGIRKNVGKRFFGYMQFVDQ
jgi:hypothetical protein